MSSVSNSNDDGDEIMIVVVYYELGKHYCTLSDLICRKVLRVVVFLNLRLREFTLCVND